MWVRERALFVLGCMIKPVLFQNSSSPPKRTPLPQREASFFGFVIGRGRLHSHHTGGRNLIWEAHFFSPCLIKGRVKLLHTPSAVHPFCRQKPSHLKKILGWKERTRYGSDHARQDGLVFQKGSSIKETHEENTNSCQQKMEMEKEREREGGIYLFERKLYNNNIKTADQGDR